ncbi:MAG: hypothetical protein JNM66_33230 [Bryobacterales bacterium]|nr:hypothetical protein [Bryobacterales bacterium]
MRTLFLLAASCAYGQFVPASYNVPESYTAKTFQLKPLGPELAKHDYDAYMSSIEHLHKTFSPGGRWPNDKITMADALKDVEGEIARFRARRSFTYAVLSLDGTRELGCVYISPSRKDGYDAAVRLWVTKAEFEKGLQPLLLGEVKAWLAKSWPFKNVLYPN